MGRLGTILKRELGYYFNSLVAYIYINVFLIVTGILFFQDYFNIGQAVMSRYFEILPLVFLFFVPAVTMRLWAEERKSGTMEIIMTLPIRDWEVVLGKYFASLIFLLTTLALSFPIALICAKTGQVATDMGPIWGGYFAATFMGAAYLALGIYLSSVTDNQIIAVIITIVSIAVLLLIGFESFLSGLPGIVQPFFAFVSLSYHFASVGKGVLDLSDLLYYASFIFFFLYLTVRSVESRKWR